MVSFRSRPLSSPGRSPRRLSGTIPERLHQCATVNPDTETLPPAIASGAAGISAISPIAPIPLEDGCLLGTAPSYSTYILIECPPPWGRHPLDTASLPLDLRLRLRMIRQQRRSLKVLLMAPLLDSPHTWLRTLIFEKPQGVSLGYQRREILVQFLDHLGDRLDTYFTAGSEVASSTVATQVRDIFIPIPTDSSPGHPTLALLEQLQQQAPGLALGEVRLWQTSALGRYPVPPSLMDMPTGRFYGGLDWESCVTLLQRRGNLKLLLNCYRGWGILPKPMQAAEGILLAKGGWDWFKVAIAPPPLPQLTERGLRSILHCRKPNGEDCRYQVDIAAHAASRAGISPQWQASYRIVKL